jgi:Putative MetA-pathway of phenol degradation
MRGLFIGGVALVALMAVGRAEAADRSIAMPLKAPAAPQNADDPCDGLLSVLDRPTVADSPCVVKPGQAVVEMGYQNGPVKGSDISHLSFLPQAELRFGLPDNWELKVFPPNYLFATQRAFAGGGQIKGFGDTAFGIKHEFGYSNGFVFAADAKVIVPTGDTAFSDGGVEANVQGIISYSVTPKLGISGMLGVSTLTNRGADGSVTRFTSMNPDLVVTYLLTDKLQLYSELFGNTVTSPGQGPNLTIQGGVQYLLAPSVEVDASVGTLLLGPAGLQSSYFNVGLGLQFSAH